MLVIGSLVVFKFYDFIAAQANAADLGLSLPRLSVTAPAGYSFYAFSAVGFLVDSYARRIQQQCGLGQTALYLAWFPKILAGPVERATNFLPQLLAGLMSTPERLVLGCQLIGWGLIKKVVVADNLAPLVDRTFGIAAFASPMDLLLAVYFFSFQIYCDFSGYSDIAIGVSMLFGLQLMENFRRPYLAQRTAEFWGERWHISLGRWFRNYLYIPLGGSRCGVLRQYLNLMLVFIASGLWHAGLGYGVGWTFLVWGALNGAYQWAGLATDPLWRMVADRFPKLSRSSTLRVLRILLTFHLIAISWVFFRAKSIDSAWLILKKISLNLTEIPALLSRFPFTTDHCIAFALITVLIAVEIVDERKSIFQRLAQAPVVLRWALCYLAIFGLLTLGRWQTHEFIYMQF